MELTRHEKELAIEALSDLRDKRFIETASYKDWDAVAAIFDKLDLTPLLASDAPESVNVEPTRLAETQRLGRVA